MNGADEDRKTYVRPWKDLRWVAAIVVTGLAIWLSVRQVQWSVVKAALAHSRALFLALAVLTVLATTFAKAVRWHLLLKQCGTRATFPRALRVLIVGQFANVILPARLGDAARAVLVGPQTTGGIAAAVGTLVVEKSMDGVMGVAVLAGLALWTPLPGWLRGPLLLFTIVTAVFLAILVAAAISPGPATKVARWSTSWMPAAARSRLVRVLSAFLQGLTTLRRPRAAVHAIAWSAAIWCLAALTNLATLSALNIEAPAWSAWLILVAGYVANFIPAVPGQVGVFEYACILALTAAGVSHDSALAFGLALHLVVYLPVLVLGPASMTFEGLGWSNLKDAAHESPEKNDAPVQT